jgi:hypothetical protein
MPILFFIGFILILLKKSLQFDRQFSFSEQSISSLTSFSDLFSNSMNAK